MLGVSKCESSKTHYPTTSRSSDEEEEEAPEDQGESDDDDGGSDGDGPEEGDGPVPVVLQTAPAPKQPKTVDFRKQHLYGARLQRTGGVLAASRRAAAR